MTTFTSITGYKCRTESRDTTRHPKYEYLYCPISFDFIRIPVVIDAAAPNCAYDHKTLLTWFSQSDVNPTTGEKVAGRVKTRPFVNLFAAMLCMEERGESIVFHQPRMDPANFLCLAIQIAAHRADGRVIELDAEAPAAPAAPTTFDQLLLRDVAGAPLTTPVLNIWGIIANDGVHRPHDQTFCADCDPMPMKMIYAAIMPAAAPPPRISFHSFEHKHENMRRGVSGAQDFYMTATSTEAAAYAKVAEVAEREGKNPKYAAARRVLSAMVIKHPEYITEPQYGGDALFSAIRDTFEFPVMNRGTYTEDFSLLDLSGCLFVAPPGARVGLKGAEFAMTDLRGAVFSRIDFMVCAFIGTDLRGTLFIDCGFRECSFHAAQTDGAVGLPGR